MCVVNVAARGAKVGRRVTPHNPSPKHGTALTNRGVREEVYTSRARIHGNDPSAYGRLSISDPRDQGGQGPQIRPSVGSPGAALGKVGTFYVFLVWTPLIENRCRVGFNREKHTKE